MLLLCYGYHKLCQLLCNIHDDICHILSGFYLTSYRVNMLWNSIWLLVNYYCNVTCVPCHISDRTTHAISWWWSSHAMLCYVSAYRLLYLSCYIVVAMTSCHAMLRPPILWKSGLPAHIIKVGDALTYSSRVYPAHAMPCHAMPG